MRTPNRQPNRQHTPHMYDQQVGATLRAARARVQLTQNQVRDASGVSRWRIFELEGGFVRSAEARADLQKLYKFYGIEPGAYAVNSAGFGVTPKPTPKTANGTSKYGIELMEAIKDEWEQFAAQRPLLQKADLAVKVARLIFGSRASDKTIEDQATDLMGMRDEELQRTFDRLSAV